MIEMNQIVANRPSYQLQSTSAYNNYNIYSFERKKNDY